MSFTATQVGDVYESILRVAPPGGLTGAYDLSVAAQLNSDSLTLANYEGSLIASDQALYTTEAALVTYDAFYNAIPSSSLLTTIAVSTTGTSGNARALTDGQVYYPAAELHNLGYSDANVWTILGADWATDTNSTFYSQYAIDATGTPAGYTAFIDSVYQHEFGVLPSATNLQNLLNDIPGLASLLGNGTTPGTTLQIMGGLYGYLLYAGETAGVGTYTGPTATFLAAAATAEANSPGSSASLYTGELVAQTAITVNLSDTAPTPTTEGSIVTFNVATANVAPGTVLSYTLTGVTASEVVGGALTGTVTVESNAASFAVHLSGTPGQGLTGDLSATLSVVPNQSASSVDTAVVPLSETKTTFTVTDTAPATTTEGSEVVFHLSNNGHVTAGEMVNYTISGVTASELAAGESLTGTVLVTSQGTVDIPVTLNSAPGEGLSGNLTLTVSLPGDANAASVDSASVPLTETLLPAVLYFDGTANQVLTGAPQNTTFVGTVDLSLLGNDTMPTGDSAVGAAGYNNTLDITVLAAVTDVLPGSAVVSDTNIQTLNVTDLNATGLISDGGTEFNLQYMPQLTTINTSASDVSYDDFFNVQNMVNVGILNNDYASGTAVDITVVDTNPTTGLPNMGPVTLTLDNAGSVDLTYLNTSGQDIVTAWTILSSGDNGVHLDGAGVSTSITATGTGSLWIGISSDDPNLYALTSVDGSGLTGAYDTTEYQFGFDGANLYNSFTFLGALGNDYVSVHQEDIDTTTTITTGTGDGNDYVHVNSYDTSDTTIVVNTYGGNTSNDSTGSGNGGDYIDLHGWRATNQNLTVNSGDGNNTVKITSADYATVNVTQGNGNDSIDIDLWNGQQNFTWSAAAVTVAVGSGINDIHINTAENGSGGDVLSTVTVTAADTAGSGSNDIHIREGYDSTTFVTVGDGNGDAVHVSNYGGDFYLGDVAFADITVGSGSGDIVSYHDHGPNGYDDVIMNIGATVLGGDTGASGTVWAHVGENSTLTENLGSGEYTLHDHIGGSDTSLYVTALDLAGGGDVIYAGLHGAAFDDATITMGGGDNDIYVWQDSSGAGIGDYASLSITTADAVGAGNYIDVNLYGNYDSAAITVGNGDNIVGVYDTSATGDYVNIQAGTGSNDITVDLSDATGSTVIVSAGPAGTGNNDISVSLDDASLSGSAATITAGNGNNDITIHGLGGGSDNTVSVTAGNGNNWVYLGNLDTGASPNDGVTVSVGTGYNTLALTSYAASYADVLSSPVAASISGFSALEITGPMYSSVDLYDFGIHNNFQQVILDGGYTGTETLTGLNSGGEIDLLWGQSFGALAAPIGDTLGNPFGTISLLLDSQATFSDDHHFGAINLNPIGITPVAIVNLTSTAAAGINGDDYANVQNHLALSDQGIHTLNIVGLGAGDPDISAVSMVRDATFHSGAISDGDVYHP